MVALDSSFLDLDNTANPHCIECLFDCTWGYSVYLDMPTTGYTVQPAAIDLWIKSLRFTKYIVPLSSKRLWVPLNCIWLPLNAFFLISSCDVRCWRLCTQEADISCRQTLLVKVCRFADKAREGVGKNAFNTDYVNILLM